MAGGLSLLITVIECGPPSFAKLYRFLSTRMCVQSSVRTELRVERRRGTVIESDVVRMIAPGMQRKEI